MNERKSLRFLLVIIASLMLLFGGIASLTAPDQGAYAAPPAAPTPVSDDVDRGDGKFFRFQPATAIAADTNTSAIEIMDFTTLDIQYVIDHGTVNTTTLTVQYSIDNSNWTDGAALVSSSAADGSAVVARVPAYGRYARVKQDVTNTNTITITLLAVGR